MIYVLLILASVQSRPTWGGPAFFPVMFDNIESCKGEIPAVVDAYKDMAVDVNAVCVRLPPEGAILSGQP